MATASHSPPESPALRGVGSTREFGLDWLRVIAFLILIFYHTGMFFVPWPWHVKNNELSQGLTWVMMFFAGWRLPLLFFISGCGVSFALRRRTLSTFARERLRRLLLPLLFGMLVVVPPQVYFERLTEGVKFSGYLDFYSSVLEFVPYPEGNFSWHHLWFVVYLLVYSLTMMPVFSFFRSERGQAAISALAGACRRPGMIYLINLPSIAVALLLGPHWPTTHNLVADWANLIGSLVTFLWGFVFASSPQLLEILERRRREWLVGALVLTVVFYAVRGLELQVRWVPRTLINSYFGMLWIFTLIGFARRHLTRDSAVLRYANEAVYPFYIVHQTITVSAGYWMADWKLALGIKLPLLAGVTFLGSWAVFEVVRRTALTRLLFGLSISAPGVGRT
jgi:surface polysaccharide O-acyltransferase-like enzyme